jgi:hypothetical protein
MSGIFSSLLPGFLSASSYVPIYLLPALLSSKVLSQCLDQHAVNKQMSPVFSPSPSQARHLQHWLTYWCLLIVLEVAVFPLLSVVLFRRPLLYFVIRTGTCLYLSLPVTMGSQRIYAAIIAPLWSLHAKRVEGGLKEVRKSVLRSAIRGLVGALTGGIRGMLPTAPAATRNNNSNNNSNNNDGGKGHAAAAAAKNGKDLPPPVPSAKISRTPSATSSMAELTVPATPTGLPQFLSDFLSLLSSGLYVFARVSSGGSMELMVFSWDGSGFCVSKIGSGDDNVLRVDVESVTGVEEEGESGVVVFYGERKVFEREVEKEKTKSTFSEVVLKNESQGGEKGKLEIVLAECRERRIFMDGLRGVVKNKCLVVEREEDEEEEEEEKVGGEEREGNEEGKEVEMKMKDKERERKSEKKESKDDDAPPLMKTRFRNTKSSGVARALDEDLESDY